MATKSQQNPHKPLKEFSGHTMGKNVGGSKRSPAKVETKRADKTLPKGSK